jgi:adenylate cyclase
VEDLIKTENIPIEDRDSPWNETTVNFVGAYQSFRYCSYTDVLEGRVKPERFRDKIVLIGGTATALFDFRAVPKVHFFPGMEIHANIMDNYLNKNFLKKASGLWSILLIVVFGLGMGFLTARTPIVAGVGCAGFLLGYFVFCQILFTYKSLILDYTSPALVLFFSYLAVFFNQFLTEKKEKVWIKNMFSQYMSPQIIETLTANPGQLKLGGEEREMTVYFSDLVGFTTLAESMGPTRLVEWLNEYLSHMSAIIFKHNGVLDKYIGDAIMAFWNAPVEQSGHSVLACLTALDQQKELVRLRKKFQEKKYPVTECRIGIHTGPMVVGNMGSSTRFNYTVMGDAVNLASRLESANKLYKTHMAISESTYQKAKNEVEARPLDLLRVQGKTHSVKVYELLARKGTLAPAHQKALAIYEEALSFYMDKQFDKAKDAFTRVLEIFPKDGPSHLYVERANGYLAVPPPADWDGAYVMTTK